MPQGINAAENDAKKGMKQQLRSLVKEWERIRNDIFETSDDAYDNQGNLIDNPAYDALIQERRRVVGQIQDIVKDRPKLRDEAIEFGFNENLLPAPNGPGSASNPSTPNAAEGAQAEAARDAEAKDKPPKGAPDARVKDNHKDHNHGGKPGGWFLPGKAGKDYRIEEYKGRLYVTYQVNYKKGRSLDVTWLLNYSAEELEKMGVDASQARKLTREQFKKRHFLGTGKDLQIHGEKRHPFRKWMERMLTVYDIPGATLLKDKGAVAVLLEAFAEGHQNDPDWISGALKKTKWWQKTSEHQRTWQLRKSEAEREGDIKTAAIGIEQKLEEMFGFQWRKHLPQVDAKQIRKWAEGIASGVYGGAGDPEQALLAWQQKFEQQAQKISGTPAWIAKQQQVEEERDFMQRPEDRMEQLRQEAISWLGYGGRPDNATLRQWAEDLTFERRSDAEWQQYLRKTKQDLYPYLAPDEKFLDRAAAYKATAEELLGTPLSWQDKLLRDFAAKDDTGKPLQDGKTALSMANFELAVRKDDRFWESKRAKEEGFAVINFLDSMFNGKPGGGF
jgi:hypothetical protein